MSTLLAVLLVASSASGSRLLFAYPPNAHATPRVQRPVYGKASVVRDIQARSSGDRTDEEDRDDDDDDDAGNGQGNGTGRLDSFGARFIRGEASSSSSSEDDSSDGLANDEDDLDLDEYATREQKERESYNTYLGIGTDVMGQLLCPPKELCNKRFELVINHLAYIAHPAASKSTYPPVHHYHSSNQSAPVPPSLAHRKTALATATPSSTLYTGNLHAESPFVDEDDDPDVVVNTRGRTSAFSSRRTSRSLPASGIRKSRDSSLTRASNSAMTMTTSGVPSTPSTYQSPLPSIPSSSANSFSLGSNQNGTSKEVASAAVSSPRQSSKMRHHPSISSLSISSTLPTGSANTDEVSQSKTSNSATYTSAGSSAAALPSSSSSPAAGGASMTLSRSLSDNLPSAPTSASFNSNVPPTLPPSLPAQQSHTSRSELDTWSIVLVIDTPPDQPLSDHLGVYYKDVIVPLMAGLKYEERRNAYVTAEAAKIASLRDKAIDNGLGLTPHIDEAIRESTLCAQLAALYKGLKRDGLANLTLNDDIDLSVLLHTELLEDSPSFVHGHRHAHLHSHAQAGSGAPYTRGGAYDRHSLPLRRKHYLPSNPYDSYKHNNNRLNLDRLTSRLTAGLLYGSAPIAGRHLDIAPWQTLLPLQDPEDLLKEVDDEHSLLTRLLEIMSPTLTFTEYETLLDTDSQSIIDIAEHLIYWRKARLIDAVSLKCIYVPNRPMGNTAGAKLLAEWSGEFAARFPELPPLPSIFATLSAPQPFDILYTTASTSVSSPSVSRSIYTEALIWLLQQGLVTQVKVYINLVATPAIKRAAYEREEKKHNVRRRASSEDSVPTEEEEDKEKEGDEDGRSTDSRDGDGPECKDASNQRSHGRSVAVRGTTDLVDPGSSNITVSSAGTSNSIISSGHTDSSNGTAQSNTRSPLPHSFPHNYPYISAAASTAAARPKRYALHNTYRGAGATGSAETDGHRQQHRHSKNRKTFLSALAAPSIIPNPSELSSEEEFWVVEILEYVQAEKGSASIQAFKRILPYLDGTHHLDEILYRASLSRKAVRRVLADFEEFLVSFVST